MNALERSSSCDTTESLRRRISPLPRLSRIKPGCLRQPVLSDHPPFTAFPRSVQQSILLLLNEKTMSKKEALHLLVDNPLFHRLNRTVQDETITQLRHPSRTPEVRRVILSLVTHPAFSMLDPPTQLSTIRTSVGPQLHHPESRERQRALDEIWRTQHAGVTALFESEGFQQCKRDHQAQILWSFFQYPNREAHIVWTTQNARATIVLTGQDRTWATVYRTSRMAVEDNRDHLVCSTWNDSISWHIPELLEAEVGVTARRTLPISRQEEMLLLVWLENNFIILDREPDVGRVLHRTERELSARQLFQQISSFGHQLRVDSARRGPR